MKLVKKAYTSFTLSAGDACLRRRANSLGAAGKSYTTMYFTSSLPMSLSVAAVATSNLILPDLKSLITESRS